MSGAKLLIFLNDPIEQVLILHFDEGKEGSRTWVTRKINDVLTTLISVGFIPIPLFIFLQLDWLKEINHVILMDNNTWQGSPSNYK